MRREDRLEPAFFLLLLVTRCRPKRTHSDLSRTRKNLREPNGSNKTWMKATDGVKCIRGLE